MTPKFYSLAFRLTNCMISQGIYIFGLRPVIIKIMAKTMPTTNNIQAILLAVPAIPLSPSTPATIAIIKNMTAQLNILASFFK